jgi:glycosyl-4,4'-diaponeurosporenoate acyltransferase
VSKRRLTVDLERFAAETRRAEIAHWLALAGTPAFALWNPPIGVVLMAVYGIAANVPCIAIQRYNRTRAQRAVARRQPPRTCVQIPR